MSNESTRRTFLTTTAPAAVIGFRAVAAKAAPKLGADETINIGVIGTGGRARQLMGTLKKIPRIRLVALCDIWQDALDKAKPIAGEAAATFKDYHRLLDSKDCDAVLIGTPDHWHVPMAVDACAAGKDVYVEKPLTHNLEEGPKVVDAQNRHKRVLQVGQQQRSMRHLQQAYEQVVKPGTLGKVHQIRLWWNRSSYWLAGPPPDYKVNPKRVDFEAFVGSAPGQPFNARRFRDWRFFWDFGGGILTDLMTHLIDVVHWYMSMDTPVAASASGGLYFCNRGWETPDTINVLLKYPGKQEVVFHGTYANGTHGAGIEFQGSHATLYVDRGRYELHGLDVKKKPGVVVTDELAKGTDSTRDYQDEAHLQNWLDCVRSREKPVCPAEVGVSAAAAAHMGNSAYRTDRVFKRKA